MNLYPADMNSIQKAADIIRAGGIVSFPTETVYGLGADARSPEAVARIFEAKNRPFFDPLIVHIAEQDQLFTLTRDLPHQALKLTGRFWPGPLTIVVPRSSAVPDIVTAGLDTVGVRMPDHTVALELIRVAGLPIAAPSANPFGYISPTRASHVQRQLGSRVDMILDGGPCTVGVESTIIGIRSDGSIALLRAGGIPVEEIEESAGMRVALPDEVSGPEAPGQLKVHYSPSTPVKIIDSSREIDIDDSSAGFIFFTRPLQDIPGDRYEVLSEEGNLREAASRFFSAMHRLDSLGLRVIYAERVPEHGLGRAIMDRMRKAAARYDREANDEDR